MISGCDRKHHQNNAVSSSQPLQLSEDPTVNSAISTEDSESFPIHISQVPPVSLDGTFRPQPELSPSSEKLFPISMKTDIYSGPSSKTKRVGFLRAGSVVEVRQDPKCINDCLTQWRAIQPYGFVPLNKESTLDVNHPIVKVNIRPPDLSQKLPYMYGIVKRGGPVYAKIPNENELREFEPNLKEHFSKWKRDKESGASYGLDVWYKWDKETEIDAITALKEKISGKNIPLYLTNDGRVPNLSGRVESSSVVKIGNVERRNGVAFIESFLVDGRRYNISTDLQVMPADRFRPIRGSEHHGVLVGKDVQLPFALVRAKNAKKWVWSSGKKKLLENGTLEYRLAVELSGKQNFFGGKLFYETKDGDWVDDRSAGKVEIAKKMPGWAEKGEKWIDVNITKQILLAYEGKQLVFATLISSGADGLGDPEKTKSTTRGIFRIHTKFVTTTMDSEVVGEEFELRDVPYVQYFQDGYAIHGAYWHDGFGQPKSHGCINLSPEDARRLFSWTDPQVPRGWHGAAKSLTGTVVFIHP